MSASHADEAQARNLFKAMSDYMGAQKVISIEIDTTLEVVTNDGQKIALASSGTVTLDRPDKIRATRTGGFADVELVSDGKALTLLGKNVNAYVQVDAPGTIDKLVDDLRDLDRYLARGLEIGDDRGANYRDAAEQAMAISAGAAVIAVLASAAALRLGVNL
jgi:hypothetical protein